MSEKVSFWEKSFLENIGRVRKKKIVIFGKTNLCKRILELLEGYHILGVIEDSERMGFYQGMRVISLEESHMLKADIMILAKQLLPSIDIFRKLENFCILHGIRLLDIYGNDLIVLINNAREKKAKGVRKKELLKEINEHDIISWDVFDTLLMRKTLMPEDVFEIIGEKAKKYGIVLNGFKKIRMQAQLESGLSNPDIFDIYEILKQIAGISDDTKKLLLNLEIECEKQLLMPRKEVLSVFYECKRRGKKVYLVSDMYFPEAILRNLLEENGVRDFDALFVSCDEKRLKNEGLLDVLQDIRQEGQKILHIGDSVVNDGICAAMVGIDYCLLDSVMDSIKKTNWNHCLLTLKTVNDRSILSLCAVELFKNPFLMKDRREDFYYDAYMFGYTIVAPAIVSFLCWLMQSLKNGNTDKVLFASRDGYLLKKIYDYVRKNDLDLPESLYFYTSRKVSVMANMQSEAVIRMLTEMSKDLEPEVMMEKIFGLEKELILPWSNRYANIYEYVWKHAVHISEKSKAIKKNYFKYMGKAGLEIGHKYAFIDFVSSGTSQKALMEFAPFDLQGYYFAWNSQEDKKQYDICAYYNDDDRFFLEYYLLIEFFMSSKEPSVSDFSKDGAAVFAKELRSAEVIKQMEQVHRAVMRFGKLYFDDLYLATEKTNHLLTNAIFSNMGMLKNDICNIDAIDDWKMQKFNLNDVLRIKRGRYMAEKIRCIEDYQACQEIIAERLKYEKELTQILLASENKSCKITGFCEVCGQKSEFLVDFKYSDHITPNLRERLICPVCNLNSRQRYMVSTVLKEVSSMKSVPKIYLYEYITPVFQSIYKKVKQGNVVGSEFISNDLVSGKIVNGILHENAENLSFEDDSFDLLVSCDVFEHVNDYKRCFKEAERVLKPNGKMFFSVPFHIGRQENYRRAEIADGRLVHYSDPIYHGNPMNKEGSLVFWDYGWTMLEDLKQAGFRDAYMTPYYDKDYGYIGGGFQYIFIAEK